MQGARLRFTIHPLTLMLALCAGLGLVATACGAGSHAAVPSQANSHFSWFKAQAVPHGWQSTALPNGAAVLSFPPDTHFVEGDAGTVSAARNGLDGQLVLYLNATPRQGAESLTGWPRFRVEHLTDDNDASSATLDGSGGGLSFRGGTGTCVIDDYVSRVGAHRYREIACFVVGRRGGSVIVAAAPAAEWGRYHAVLERAVDAYTVR